MRVRWTMGSLKQSMHLKYYFNTFILFFCLCSNLSPSLGYCVYFSKGTHGRHVNHACWDLQSEALQVVTATVQRKPTQEHHSNVEAGMAELPRQLWDRTMAGCLQLCRQLGTG